MAISKYKRVLNKRCAVVRAGSTSRVLNVQFYALDSLRYYFSTRVCVRVCAVGRAHLASPTLLNSVFDCADYDHLLPFPKVITTIQRET